MQRTQRRLAAVLAADVVGYSRLMEIDEAGTLARLKTNRETLIEPKIAEHDGRVVKLMGDGLLAEFASVVDAVSCAVETQRALAAVNAELPQDQRLELRIGVNLGDVLVEGDDIYGEGVNVAARLERLCTPGGVLISGTVFDQVAGKARPADRISRRAARQEPRKAGPCLSGGPWRTQGRGRCARHPAPAVASVGCSCRRGHPSRRRRGTVEPHRLSTTR